MRGRNGWCARGLGYSDKVVAQIGPCRPLEHKDREEENLEPAPISAAPRVDDAPVHIIDHTDGPARANEPKAGGPALGGLLR